MDIKSELKKVKKFSYKFANVSLEKKNETLKYIVLALDEKRSDIVKANSLDIIIAEENGVSKSIIKHLSFDEYKIDSAIEGIKSLIGLPDPLDNTTLSRQLDEGLDLYRVTCPIGLVATVFEANPDVFIAMSTMALKSGNACVLKGGKEAENTIDVLFKILREASEKSGIGKDWVLNLKTSDELDVLFKSDECIDLIVPRGSSEFVNYVIESTNIPVLGRFGGICHVYIDEDFDENMAINIVIDSKTQYVSISNSMETLLIHKNVSSEFIERLFVELDKKRVVINASPEIKKIIEAEELTEEKLRTEFSDYEMNIKMVDSLDEAIEHINNYGSGHTDVIVSKNGANALKFMDYVDSANVFYNCSTRFSDGLKYGFGAELGLSTSKVHARGPIGLEGLVIYKYKMIGHGQLVEDYAKGEKVFNYKELHRDFE